MCPKDDVFYNLDALVSEEAVEEAENNTRCCICKSKMDPDTGVAENCQYDCEGACAAVGDVPYLPLNFNDEGC
jgi:hypothetical protein